MNRRTLLLVVLLAALSLLALPLAAQDAPASPDIDLLTYVPADSAGFVAIRSNDEMITNLAVSLQAAQILQPSRVDFGAGLGYDDFFPLNLFDLETVDFTALIQPWLGDEIVYIYNNFSPTFAVEPDDFVVLFETSDQFGAISALRPVLEGQDLPQGQPLPDSVNYRDAIIYRGDRAAFALAPEVVLIGSETMIRAALDARAGEREQLISATRYNDLRAAAPQDAALFAYVQDEAAASGFAALIGNCADTGALFGALGGALGEFDNRDTLESALLTGAIDAIGISLVPTLEQESTLRAVATLHTTLPAPTDSVVISEDILAFMPRSAAVVQSGPDGQSALYGTLLALPLANYAGCALGGFPVPPSQGGQLLPLPTSEDLLSALEGFTDALTNVSTLDLRDDLLDHLDGAYAVAVLPRPNAPTPLFNTPYDLLLVAQVDDGAEALAGVTALIQNYLPAEFFEQVTVDGTDFTVLQSGNTPILSIGALDNVLMIATGSGAAQALEAKSGDNRLIDQTRWQTLTANGTPHLYVDVTPFYATFFSPPGGTQALPVEQLALQTHYLGDGLYEMVLQLTLP
jgi:hypothetical protein